MAYLQARKNAGLAQTLLDQYNANKQSAVNNVHDAVYRALSARGIPLSQYQSDYDTVINNILQGLPQLDAPKALTPYTYTGPAGHTRQGVQPFRALASYQNLPDLRQVLNPDQITQQVLDRISTTQQGNLQRQLGNWTNTNTLQSLLPDNADDDIINSIIGSQYTTAQSQLDNALKRGTLTQGAYDTALSALNGQRTAAQSRLQSIGQGVITQGRQQLQNDIDKITSNIGNWQPGSNYDINGALTGIQNDASTLKSNLEGGIRSALGNNSNFFDVNAAMNTGTSQSNTGGTNPIISQIGESGDLADALAAMQKRQGGSYGMKPQSTPNGQKDRTL